MESGPQLLELFKGSAGGPGPELGLIVGKPPQLILRPVATWQDRLNRSDVCALTEWRNRFVTSFLTEFHATEERTANWLVNVVGPNPNKILFMVDHIEGDTFGYMGLDFIDWTQCSGEADAIVRGKSAPRGAMATALTALVVWARSQLGLGEICVRVRSDNPALRFFEKVGFQEFRRVALIRHDNPNEIHWREGEMSKGCSPFLVYLRYKR